MTRPNVLSSNTYDHRGKKSLRHHAAEGDTPGYDISYREAGKKIGVEVKGTGAESFGNFELTQGERETAEKMGARYRVWLVAGVRSTSPVMEVVRNPARMLEAGQLTSSPVLCENRAFALAGSR